MSVFSAAAPGEFAISQWVQVGFSSLLARRRWMGELAQNTLETVFETFEKEVAESFLVFFPTESDYGLASSFVLREGSSLRGPDALHLAIAFNNGVNAIYSLDVGLIKEAKALGLPASDAGVGV